MKRLTVILLLLSILLNGCTAKPLGNDTDQTVSTPPEGAYQLNYDGPADRTYRAVIFKDTAYYECDPYERIPWQPHIYSVPLGEETAATDLLKGELLDLSGSILIGKTEESICIADVSVPSLKWIDVSDGEYISHLQINQTLYIYVLKQQKNYAVAIDLKNLKFKHLPTVSDIRRAIAVDNEIYYLTKDGFYRGDPIEKNGVLIGSANDGDLLYATNGCIFVYQDCTFPHVYDCKTGSYSTPKIIQEKIRFISGPYQQ